MRKSQIDNYLGYRRIAFNRSEDANLVCDKNAARENSKLLLDLGDVCI